jgi:hypothetical protein
MGSVFEIWSCRISEEYWGGLVLGEPNGIQFDVERGDPQGLNHFASLISDIRHHFDSYYILAFTIQSKAKGSWIDSSVKSHKSDTNVVSGRGFFSSHDLPVLSRMLISKHGPRHPQIEDSCRRRLHQHAYQAASDRCRIYGPAPELFGSRRHL